MTSRNASDTSEPLSAADLLLPAGAETETRPIWLARPENGGGAGGLEGLAGSQRAWLKETGWTAASGKCALLPGRRGTIAGAVLGLGRTEPPDPLIAGRLPRLLPPGDWHFETRPDDPFLASLAWLLGAYRFSRYKRNDGAKARRLRLPDGVDRDALLATAESIWLGRDLINTPANDMGPGALEAAARSLAEAEGAEMRVVTGEALLDENFPLIHAVGRASDRAPRLIDMRWQSGRRRGRGRAHRLTLVGKGICFDTGGLDIKPSQAMALMKKDMGGAASALALGAMIMRAGLDVALRILIPAADNAISGNAFRPGDVLASRKGLSVEIGNTDAEGRLVLADALALADEEAPDTLVSFATLTGAARVALGPDLPPVYTEDDRIAEALQSRGIAIGDPVWRLPLWPPYDRLLESEIADVNHISGGPFAGSITAALFLRRFVEKAGRYIHFDIYGWVPNARPGRPKGGEPQAARLMFELVRDRLLAKRRT